MTAQSDPLQTLIDQSDDLAGILRAVAHPARLTIVGALIHGERGVSDLETVTGIRQPGLSRELGKLREAGVVQARRQSKAVFYALCDPRAERVVAALCQAADQPSFETQHTVSSETRQENPADQRRARTGASLFARAGWATPPSR